MKEKAKAKIVKREKKAAFVAKAQKEMIKIKAEATEKKLKK